MGKVNSHCTKTLITKGINVLSTDVAFNVVSVDFQNGQGQPLPETSISWSVLLLKSCGMAIGIT